MADNEDPGNQVVATLEDPLWGDNTWSIGGSNAWIGRGSGTYTVAKKIEHRLTVLTAESGGSVRFQLYMTDYAGSLKSGAAGGVYVSPFGAGNHSLKWWGSGAIRPEPNAG
jgi:hypothetical protein